MINKKKKWCHKNICNNKQSNGNINNSNCFNREVFHTYNVPNP